MTVKKGKEMVKKIAVVNTSICVACGCCMTVCKREAITVPKGVCAKVDEKKCVGCGMCVKECPAGIITLEEITNEQK